MLRPASRADFSRHSLRFWDRKTGALLRAFGPLEPVSELRYITLVALTADGALVWLHGGAIGQTLATGGEDAAVVLWEVADHPDHAPRAPA